MFHFVNLLSFANSLFILSMRKITWLNTQQPKTRGHVEHLIRKTRNWLKTFYVIVVFCASYFFTIFLDFYHALKAALTVWFGPKFGRKLWVLLILRHFMIIHDDKKFQTWSFTCFISIIICTIKGSETTNRVFSWPRSIIWVILVLWHSLTHVKNWQRDNNKKMCFHLLIFSLFFSFE